MVVILLGPPGVGKGTQAVRLADSIGWEHVSTGDLLRAARRDGTEPGRKAQGFMDAGELVPDELILDLVREHLGGVAPEAGILFDGFPRTTEQADGLDEVLGEVDRHVDGVILLEAPDDELIRRLSGRRSCPECGAVYNVHFSAPATEGTCDRCGGTLVHRADDEADTVRRRLEVYAELTAPLIEYYQRHDAKFRTVDAARPVDDVQASFRAAVELV
jgi:adenylate kinase